MNEELNSEPEDFGNCTICGAPLTAESTADVEAVEGMMTVCPDCQGC